MHVKYPGFFMRQQIEIIYIYKQMATNINQAHAQFLARNGLDNVGSNEVVFDASNNAVIRLAAMIVEQTQKNLQQGGQVSVGTLFDSFEAVNPREANGVFIIDIQAADYYDYQNKGVKGLKGGSSSNNYSFKNAFPSTKMVSAIEAWMTRAGISTTNVNPHHAITGQESKNVSISAYDSAYAIAKSIKAKGIRGTGYFDKALLLAQQYAQEVLGKSLATDVINAL